MLISNDMYDRNATKTTPFAIEDNLLIMHFNKCLHFYNYLNEICLVSALLSQIAIE